MKQKSTYSKNAIIAVCALVYFVSYFARKDFAAVMLKMISEGVITDSLGGLIGTGLFIAYGIGQLISGYLGDKLPPRVLLVFGLTVTALANIAMPFISEPYLFVIVWAANGFAQAMLWPPIVRILAENLDRESYVTGNLIVTSAAHVSTIILYIYAPLCFVYSGWEAVFISASVLSVFAIIAFILALVFFLPKDTLPLAPMDYRSKDGGLFKILLQSGILQVFCAIVAMGFLRDGIESWLPTLYAAAFNRPAEESTLLSAILPVFSILSVVAIKILHKTKTFANETRGAAILFAISAILCVPLVFLVNASGTVAQILSLILAALVCACMHACNFLYISCLPGRFAYIGKSATTSGFCNAFTYVGAAAAAYGFAVISSSFGWSVTIGVWGVVAVIGAAFSMWAGVRYTSFIQNGRG